MYDKYYYIKQVLYKTSVNKYIKKQSTKAQSLTTIIYQCNVVKRKKKLKDLTFDSSCVQCRDCIVPHMWPTSPKHSICSVANLLFGTQKVLNVFEIQKVLNLFETQRKGKVKEEFQFKIGK